MSFVKLVSRSKIYEVVAKTRGFELDKLNKRKIFPILPQPIRVLDGRINGFFLPHFASQIVKTFPGRASAEELIEVLQKEGLATVVLQRGLAEGLDFANMYKAMMVEGERLLARARQAQSLRVMASRYETLHHLVVELSLGSDVNKNRELVAQAIHNLLGYSGVRVYSVDLETRRWKHTFVSGEEGLSRFIEPRVPADRSEKSFMTKLIRSEVAAQELEQASQKGSYEWFSGEKWGYLYIPDRSLCDFVEFDQLQKDEAGDPDSQRKGYGEGGAREILYLVFGSRGDKRVEVYMITNWRRRNPIFTDKKEDLALLGAFAASMAQSNELIRVYQKLRDLAVVDELTGLYNRRYFNSKLDEEYRRAKRTLHPLSLVMIDIDHFKDFNDRYGHKAGDMIIAAVASVVKRAVRDVPDVVARLGGDEFAVIVPEVNITMIETIASRINKSVDQALIKILSNDNIEQEVKVTVSVGAASYPDHASSAGDLFLKADTALYGAKGEGRNRVKVAPMLQSL
jgi:diguanylate cyclase (GGDEF)-like protein